jgi:hypothetical protein
VRLHHLKAEPANIVSGLPVVVTGSLDGVMVEARPAACRTRRQFDRQVTTLNLEQCLMRNGRDFCLYIDHATESRLLDVC